MAGMMGGCRRGLRGDAGLSTRLVGPRPFAGAHDGVGKARAEGVDLAAGARAL